MNQRAKRTVFLGTVAGGLIGGCLGGLLGMALGLGSAIPSLTPPDLSSGLIAGALLSLVPALIIGLVSVERYERFPRRRTRLHAPFHAAVLSFLPVAAIMTCWVGSSASC